LYNNQNFSQKDYPDLPSFTYIQKSQSRLSAILLLLIMAIGLFGLGFLVSKKGKYVGILNQG